MTGERLMQQGDAAASSLHPHEAEQNQLLSKSNDGSQVAAVANDSNHPSSLGTPSNQHLLLAPPLSSLPTVPYASVPLTSLVPHPPSSTMFNPQIVPRFPMGSLYPRMGLNPFSQDPVNFQQFQMQQCSLGGAERFSGVSHNVGACFSGTNTHPQLDALGIQTTDRSFVNSASHLPSRLANNQNNASGLPGHMPSLGGFTYPSGNPGGSGSLIPAQPIGGWPLSYTNVGTRGVNCISSMSGLGSRNSPSAQEPYSLGGNIRTRTNTVRGTHFEAQRRDNRQRGISSLPTTRMASSPGFAIHPFVGAFRQAQPGHAVAASNGNEDAKDSTCLTKSSTQRDVATAKHPGTTESKGDETTHDTALHGRKRGRKTATETATAIPQVPLRMSRARKRSTSQSAPDLSQSAISNASRHLAGPLLTSTPTACQSSPLSKPQSVPPSCLVRTASASHPCFPPSQTASPQVSTSNAPAQSSVGPLFRPSKCQATASYPVGTASIPAASLSAPIKPALPIRVPSKTETGPFFHIKRKEPPVTPKLIGYSCFFCKRDLSYAEDGPYTQPSPSPQVAVLACGHSFHALCLQRITPDEQAPNPPCIPCAMGEK